MVVFNFLLPTNGVSPIDPEDSTKYIATLGADADLAQIYIVVILLGMVLYTRAIVGLWLASPSGDARQRDDDWNVGAVAALGLWGVVLGLGFAETSVAEKSNTELAAVAASGGVPEAVAAATGAGTVKTLHAGFFGVYQVAAYVAFISLIPIGGGIMVGGIVRREFAC